MTLFYILPFFPQKPSPANAHVDTCGVHNLHGMPAIASAIFSAIFAYFATKDAYGDSLYTIFPGMKNSTMMEDEHEMIIGVK